MGLAGMDLLVTGILKRELFKSLNCLYAEKTKNMKKNAKKNI